LLKTYLLIICKSFLELFGKFCFVLDRFKFAKGLTDLSISILEWVRFIIISLGILEIDFKSLLDVVLNVGVGHWWADVRAQVINEDANKFFVLNCVRGVLVEQFDDLLDILPSENILIAESLVKLRGMHGRGLVCEESLEGTLAVFLEGVLSQVNGGH